MTYYKHHVFVCTNQKEAGKTCCANTGGVSFFNYLKARLLALNAHGPNQIRVSQSGCLGRCSQGPCLVIYPEGIWYQYASYADLDVIVEQQLLLGQRVERLLMP